MATPEIRVEGLKELQKQLRQVKDVELNAQLKATNLAIAQKVVDLALPNVPVRSGRLRGSVRASGTLSGAVGRAGKASVPYAAAIHWGWPKRGIVGHPFLRDAAKRVEADVVDEYARDIQRMLDRTVKGH